MNYEKEKRILTTRYNIREIRENKYNLLLNKDEHNVETKVVKKTKNYKKIFYIK